MCIGGDNFFYSICTIIDYQIGMGISPEEILQIGFGCFNNNYFSVNEFQIPLETKKYLKEDLSKAAKNDYYESKGGIRHAYTKELNTLIMVLYSFE